MAQPRIIIVGGGFGGLAAAKALKNTPGEVILVDRTNHHLFQPLLYQVATAVLNPSQIATPIRSILRNQQKWNDIVGTTFDMPILSKKSAAAPASKLK